MVKNPPASREAGHRFGSPGWEDPEKENGNILQYSLLGTHMLEEPGGLQALGCRVGHTGHLVVHTQPAQESSKLLRNEQFFARYECMTAHS